MEVEGLRDGSSPPDGSKDLEKDEREWLLRGVGGDMCSATTADLSPARLPLHETERVVPKSRAEQAEARLQQVEAENARLKKTLSLACEEAERKGITAGETILRAVADIEMAVEGFCEDLVCPFRCGWDELLKPDAHADECPITLAKQLLQAKEEGT